MRCTVDHLHAVDIPIYFALAMNMITVRQIVNAADCAEFVSNEFNLDHYVKYKKKNGCPIW